MKTKLLLLSLLFASTSIAQDTDSLQHARLQEKLHHFVRYCDRITDKMLKSDQLDTIHFYAGLMVRASDEMMLEIRKVIPKKEYTTVDNSYQAMGMLYSLSDDPTVAALGTVYMALGNQSYTVCSDSDPDFIHRVRDINDFAWQLSKVRKLEKAWRKTTRLMLESRNMRHILPPGK